LCDFSWHSARRVAAHRAFSHDFSIKNVIPNASGLVFRKPRFTEDEIARLYQYRFAGDWYFYALVARGGEIAYSPQARSFFRVNAASTSRSSFFTDRHLLEHSMIVHDLWAEYGIDDATIDAHANALAVYFDGKSKSEIRKMLSPATTGVRPRPMRVCIAAHSFAVGGGEVLPLELANELKRRGCHVTYLVIERPEEHGSGGIRARLRPDIPVVYFEDIADRFDHFIADYGIEVLNSHNVSVEYRLYCHHVKVGIPFVASLHGGYETVEHLLTPDFAAFLNRTVTSWLYLADKNTQVLTRHGVVPSDLKHSFNALPKFAGEWIDRGEFRARYNIAADAFVFVICSRAIREKGWSTAVDVVKALSARASRPVHLVLIGDGPFLSELEEASADLPCVTFLGHIDNPVRYFRCCDMGIFPSTFSGETFPLFLIECFQVGLPVITTDIGEIPRMMGSASSGRPGAVVSHKESPEVIADEMTDIALGILANGDLYRQMCAAALETSDRFSLQQLGDLYETTFRRLAAHSPREKAAAAA
jgi:glycosyltransferase involved in cell wall biosynthesis